MDLALSNLQRLICHKTQPTNQHECEGSTIKKYKIKTFLKIHFIYKNEYSTSFFIFTNYDSCIISRDNVITYIIKPDK